MTKLKDLINVKPLEVPDHPPCAFCGSTETEFISLFGQFLLIVQYYCHHCHSAFDWCKLQDEGEEEQGT